VKAVVSTLWRRAGSVHLTVVLCFLLTLDLGIGYPVLKSHLPTFAPMGDVGLCRWLLTFGLYNLEATFWFFALLLLLGALAANTFVCTTDRMAKAARGGRIGPSMLFRLAPHIIHYAVLMILAGYFLSYMFSASLPGRALRPGESLALPEGAGTVAFVGFSPEYAAAHRLPVLRNAVLYPNARMVVARPGGKTETRVLNFNRPVRAGNWTLYLRDFSPRQRKRGMNPPFIETTLRRDPSSAVYLAGVALFVFGLGLYVFDRVVKR